MKLFRFFWLSYLALIMLAMYSIASYGQRSIERRAWMEDCEAGFTGFHNLNVEAMCNAGFNFMENAS